MDNSERENLLKNINFIVESAYRQGRVNDEKHMTKKKIIESMEMSYVTYLKIKKSLSNADTYSPQDGTLYKFVECFNRNWMPEINVPTLKRKDLAHEVDAGVYTSKELPSNKLSWYDGCYFCYYYTRRSRGLRYGVMNVYYYNNDYYAQMITGFSGEYDLDYLLDNYPEDNVNIEFRRMNRTNAMIEFFSKPSEVEAKFKKFLYGRDTKNIKYYYYNGKIEAYENALLFNLLPEDRSYKKMITFKRQVRSRQPEYQGGLGAELTLAHEIHSTYANTLKHIGISRNYITDIENIKKILSIDVGDGENINLTEKDYLWFNLSVGREIETPPDINP